MMDRYGGLVGDPGIPDADGESWAEAAERLSGKRRRLHPLAQEVCEDG